MNTRGCPICAEMMVRVPSDGTAIVFRCGTCGAEIAKAMPRDHQRRRQSRNRRLCGRQTRMTRQFWRVAESLHAQ